MTDAELERTLEAARRAAPAVTASRSQTWRWAVLSRLDGRRRGRTPAIVALTCATAAVVAIVGWQALGWRQLGPKFVAKSDPIASTSPRDQILADGSRIVPDGPATV